LHKAARALVYETV